MFDFVYRAGWCEKHRALQDREGDEKDVEVRKYNEEWWGGDGREPEDCTFYVCAEDICIVQASQGGSLPDTSPGSQKRCPRRSDGDSDHL